MPRINAAVDACNAVSYHTGLPISVVDIARTSGPLRVAVPAEGSYVFNASGQEIRVDGLLASSTGPKPHRERRQGQPWHEDVARDPGDPERRVGSRDAPGHARAALEWYASVLARAPRT